MAALNGHSNLCEILIYKHKFDVLVTDNIGLAALHYAAMNGSYEPVKLFTHKDTDILLETKHGSNCLHIAASKGHLSLCKMFITGHKFDPFMTDDNGWMPLHLSVQNGSFELFNFFNDMGAHIYLKTMTERTAFILQQALGI